MCVVRHRPRVRLTERHSLEFTLVGRAYLASLQVPSWEGFPNPRLRAYHLDLDLYRFPPGKLVPGPRTACACALVRGALLDAAPCTLALVLKHRLIEWVADEVDGKGGELCRRLCHRAVGVWGRGWVVKQGLCVWLANTLACWPTCACWTPPPSPSFSEPPLPLHRHHAAHVVDQVGLHYPFLPFIQLSASPLLPA